MELQNRRNGEEVKGRRDPKRCFLPKPEEPAEHFFATFFAITFAQASVPKDSFGGQRNLRSAKLAEHFFATSSATATEVKESYEVRSCQNNVPRIKSICL